ncbi:MAG: glycosyltransferase, partial [Candidatus Omnitrophica bacterium]|nr:glycosyltransferase [Candidatus Omnitrophota bacterium]
MNDVKISVVIPVKDGEKHLDSLLKAVFSQNINAEFEVIVVDSGSKDSSLDIIKEYPVKLYQIDARDFNHGITRNLGVSKAQGKYVILMTQDAIPRNKRWMRELVENLERDGRIAGAYSRQLPSKDSSHLTQVRVNSFLTSKRERRESQLNDIKDL